MFHVTHYGKAFQVIYLLMVRMVIQYLVCIFYTTIQLHFN
jgi:hypothetical protein